MVVALDDGELLPISLAMSGFGMDFDLSSILNKAADPLVLVRTVAYIVFDTRCEFCTLLFRVGI